MATSSELDTMLHWLMAPVIRHRKGTPMATATAIIEAPRGKELKKVVSASVVGTAIELYDFFLFQTAAATVFSRLFFPSLDPHAGTIAAFGTFAVAWVARPFGGLVFGHFGDRVGRKWMLVITILMMGFGTASIGLLPTYNNVGILAPILLVVLRVIQGLAFGGEWGGAVLLAVEYSPHRRWGLIGSWPQVGSPIGLLLSTGVFAAFSQLQPDQFLAWGWRVPFLLSFILVIVGLVIRLRIDETPVFREVVRRRKVQKIPILTVMKSYPRQVLLGIGTRFGSDAMFNIANVFMLSYGSTALGIPRGTLLTAIMTAAALQFVSIPIFGWLSDVIGRKKLFMIACAYIAVYGFAFFPLIETKQTNLILLGYILALSIGFACTYSLLASMYSEIFTADVRFTGISLVYQIAGIFTSGPVPIIAVLLIASYGSTQILAIYICAAAILSLVCTYFLRLQGQDIAAEA
jgi:metabolite-proton symporter